MFQGTRVTAKLGARTEGRVSLRTRPASGWQTSWGSKSNTSATAEKNMEVVAVKSVSVFVFFGSPEQCFCQSVCDVLQVLYGNIFRKPPSTLSLQPCVENLIFIRKNAKISYFKTDKRTMPNPSVQLKLILSQWIKSKWPRTNRRRDSSHFVSVCEK